VKTTADLIQPITYIAGQGIIAGLITGYAVRKLNKVIAAALGLALVAVNVGWFIKILGIETSIPLLDEALDALITLLPYSPQQLFLGLEPSLPLLTSIPFAGGFILGTWIGFKIA
jgi:uncharacterized membrane protein (Fun14 family)